jgi:hypothetical protein
LQLLAASSYKGNGMRLLITMRMASGSGNLVHQIIAEHDAETLEEFVDELHRQDFVILTEYYRNPTTQEYYSRGPIAVNHAHIGKIKAITNHGD